MVKGKGQMEWRMIRWPSDHPITNLPFTIRASGYSRSQTSCRTVTVLESGLPLTVSVTR